MDVPIRVLVVEDNPADVRLLQVALASDPRSRYEVDAVGTIGEGLRLLDAYEYEALLLDLTLPDSTGIASFERVRETMPDLPVVILTQTEDDELATQAVAAGAQDYLVKGQTNAALLGRTLRHAVERQRLVNQLRQMDRARRDFIAHAAHELRTPLTTIAGMSALIEERRGELSEERFEKMLDSVLTQSRRAGELAKALLDLSQVESGDLGLDVRPADVGAIVRDAVRASPGGDAVDVSVDPGESLDALVDRARLEQILVNLVSNAGRYGNRVWVSATRRDDRVVISVEDDGPGVPDELVPHLFDPFVRGPAARGDGTGLGLTITRRLVEALNGTIGYEPREPSGARFAVWLPAVVGAETYANNP
ncbi:MAG TPA: hybrid sensor histidine kinase/response regulator [Actinomycetota bacterium]|nr:hybrid sensor histidine kinase/response regulator [Actinomycetota bacterium]